MVKSYTKNTGTKKEPKIETFWEFQVRYIDDDGSVRQKHMRKFTSERECRREMNRFLASKGGNTKREGVNFEYLFEEYKRNTWFNHSPSTIQTNTFWFKLHILPYFRNFLVTQIKLQDVMAFQNTLRQKKLSDHSIKDITAQLKSFMNYCLATGRLDRIPFDKRYTAVNVVNEKEKVVWDYGEFSKFIKTFGEDLTKKTLFSVLFVTGMRREELLGLQKGDFDFKNNTIKIQRTYLFIDGKEYLSSQMKTTESRRTISIPESLVSMLKDYFDANPQITDTDRAFPFKPRRINKWMDIGIKESGVPRTTPHGMRHSLITNALSAGIPVKAVQEYVGHATSRTTLDVYAHTSRKDVNSVGSLYETNLRLVV